MSENIEIDVEIVTETELALLVDDGDVEEWVPKSLIKDFDWESDYIGTHTSIIIPERVAIEKGFV